MKQSYLSSSSPVHNHFNHMKRILLALTLVGILAAGLAGFAQTNSPATDAAAATASSPPAAEAPAPAAPQVAANDAAQPATPPAAPPAAEAADAPRLASVAQPNAVIPLIVMDDVPLTDAIRNLARQAGLNYMLDPKIGYGQMGADGKPTPQPSVSLRWENITAEQALTALLNNYTLQLLEDPKSKIARITTKDPAAPEPLFTKIIQLKFAGPTNIVANAQATLTDKRSRVMPDNRTSQLVVVATEKEIAAVDELVRQLDTQTKQVLIEARLLETVVNPTTSKGVDWSGTLAGQNVTFGNGLLNGTTPIPQTVQNISQGTTVSPGTPTTTTTTLPGGRTSTGTTTPASSVSSSSGSSSSSVMNYLLGTAANGAISMDTARGLNPATFFLNADGLKATLSFLNTYAETKVISSPRTVTLDNETSLIEVGTQYPIVNTTAGTANTTGGSQVTYSNLTVRLSVTPRISANNYVKLSVSPRIIRLGDQVASIVGGVANNVPSFETREITTSVMIPSGNTLVMGGLIQDNVHQQNTKVPVLGDIPGLGLLFRSDTKSRTKSNLIIFLTPTIVEDEDFQPTKSNFLKTKVPIKDSIEDDWSAWDSGKPKEWGKKVAPQEQSFDDAMAQPGTSSKTPTSK
jgi:type II secretory pathway component HofQ